MLEYIKSVLTVPQDNADWDDEILMHINSSVMILTQLGATVFEDLDVDETTDWPDFGSDVRAKSLTKAYVGNRVKSVFDASPNKTIQDNLGQYLGELESRIQLHFSPTDV